MPLAPTVKLNNGLEMPMLGLGTYLVIDSHKLMKLIYYLKLSFEHDQVE